MKVPIPTTHPHCWDTAGLAAPKSPQEPKGPSTLVEVMCISYVHQDPSAPGRGSALGLEKCALAQEHNPTLGRSEKAPRSRVLPWPCTGLGLPLGLPLPWLCPLSTLDYDSSSVTLSPGAAIHGFSIKKPH